jgi:protein-disulfide isomerase
VIETRKEALDMGVHQVPTLLWLGKKLEGYPTEEDLTRFLALEP